MKTLNRSRLNYKLRECNRFPITFASAPSGFGKTTTFRQYLGNKGNDCIWLSMYNQNDEQWAWNKLITSISKKYNNSTLSTEIPLTHDDMDSFTGSIASFLKKPLFILLDDIQLKQAPSILKALSMYSYFPISSLHFCILTQNTFDLLAPYHFSNNCYFLQTHDFAFTKKELFHLCKLENIQISSDNIDELYTYTNGWIGAIYLMLETYKHYNNMYYKGNLNNLLHRVLYDELTTNVQEGLMKLSTLKNFTLSFALQVCSDQPTINTLMQLEKENHFIQTIDHETYQFIPVIKEFLKKCLLTSTIHKQDLTRKIASCYIANNEPINAMETYLQIKDFQAIMEILEQHDELSFGDIAPALYIQIFNDLPDTFKTTFPHVYLKWITDCITNFPQMNGHLLLEDFKERIQQYPKLEEQQLLWGEYYFIHAFLHFNDVRNMMEDFKKAHTYFNGHTSKFTYPFMITSFGSSSMLFLYHNQVGKLQETVTYIADNLHYFIEITNGIHTGTENLIKAEYYFETGCYHDVSLYATLAYKEALQKNQISGAICSLFLQGRLALSLHNQGDYHYIKNQLSALYKKTNVPILHNQIDCSLGYLDIINDTYEGVKDWLKEGSFEDVYILPEAMMMVYIIHGMCLVKARNSIKLKQLAETITIKNTSITFTFADIYASLFNVIYYYGSGKLNESLAHLHKALKLCEQDHIVTPFVELSFAFVQLLDMYSTTSSFEEKVIALAKTFHIKDNQSSASVSLLTQKEVEVLRLYALGNKIKEVAFIKHISVNTVQSHMKSIYKKLNISSKVEAIKYYNNNFK